MSAAAASSGVVGARRFRFTTVRRYVSSRARSFDLHVAKLDQLHVRALSVRAFEAALYPTTRRALRCARSLVFVFSHPSRARMWMRILQTQRTLEFSILEVS